MNQTQLQHTVFQVEKLMNVVGIGRTSAYQVITSPGALIGVIGPVAEPRNIVCANDKEHSPSLFSRIRKRLGL